MKLFKMLICYTKLNILHSLVLLLIDYNIWSQLHHVLGTAHRYPVYLFALRWMGVLFTPTDCLGTLSRLTPALLLDFQRAGHDSFDAANI